MYAEGAWLARETEGVMQSSLVVGVGLRQAKGELWLEGRANWIEGHARDVGFRKRRRVLSGCRLSATVLMGDA